MLSRSAIKRMMKLGLIEVEPNPSWIGTNSIDLCLGDSLKRYSSEGRVEVMDPAGGGTFFALDPQAPPSLVDVPKITEGPHTGKWLLVPGQFYLGVTRERTKTIGVVPSIDGRSTCGRLSIEAHKTAGIGDNGFNGRWTLEIEVTEPVLVAPGDRLFQVYFEPCWSEDALIFFEKLGWGDMKDLRGVGDGYHYHNSGGVEAAAPLDKAPDWGEES